ncbi:heavy metal-associated isoprenylated plant protein 3-like [Vigna umbellata]|uniref:Heavy metal-associated isoprenylated plant protein n=2 Tax=Phaseolus angularis TaxID=3914 RepID=A0A0L9TE79_PHAAN|nr:heavy metal-associated isoprenylated plant protein 3 [Vigna angularis]XP_047155842.1 heavy metal-associated isoprenylated plant protein 3-like [Vigna umbellata]KAG2397543.1 Heavy metal-associated isoprenylated plant protein [Vigna angularis]KOM28842.1 hypothetical protein LR48_Vigan598s000300 [Vigna angularis]BAT90522.1 hypothetical protein VIGAN_06178000 [Vigna angularis var. angularis]
MGAKKKSGGGNGNKENEDGTTTVVLKIDFHCDGCASKITRHLRSLQGVETVQADGDAGKVTVTGKIDAVKVRDNLAEKMKKKVEIVSPQPKKEKEESKDAKANNKTQDKKNKDKEVTTAVLKMALHCQGCLDRIGKTVLKTKGVKEMAIDKEKETVTVKGTMDVKALAENLMEKLRRKVEVVPPKKEKEGDKEGEKDKEGSGKKKNKGGGGGGGDSNEGVIEKIDYSRMEYLPQPAFGFGYGYGHGNSGGYSYVPVYPEQMHFHLHAPPPQIFSDENPNACSVM